MAQPNVQDVHIDAALSNMSVAYVNEGYIADQIFPAIPSAKQSDKYYVYTKDFWFRNSVERRGPGGSYAEGGFELSNTNFECINKGLSFPVPYEVPENQDSVLDVEEDGAAWLADQFQLDREIGLAAAIMDATAWTSSTTLSGTTQWSDYANSDPIGDVETAKQAIKKLTGQKANVLVMGQEVWDKLKFHPDLLDLYKHTVAAVLTTEMVAKVLEVERIIVGGAIYNTTAEGSGTFSGSYIWPKNALLLYVPKAPGKRVPASGYTFIWKQSGFVIPIKRVDQPLRGRNVLLGDHAFVQKVVGADLGYEIIDAVA